MIDITKASGEQDEFSEEKIRKSLICSGADEAQIDKIIKEVSTNSTMLLRPNKITVLPLHC